MTAKTEVDPETVLVEVPAEFAQRFGLDREEPVREARRIIHGQNGRDPAGFTKARTEALRVGWRGFLLGGGTVDTEARIVGLSGQRAELQSRLLSASNPVLRESLEAAVASLEAQLAADRELLSAAGDAVKDNQKVRLVRIEAIRRDLQQASAVVERYQQARFPAPPEAEEEVIRLERELVEAEKVFAEGRVALEALVKERAKAETDARKALAGALLRRGSVLGAEALDSVKDLDPDLLERFPNRTPAEAVKAYRTALKIAETARQLDPAADVMAAFHQGATPALAVVVSAAAGYRIVGRRVMVGA